MEYRGFLITIDRQGAHVTAPGYNVLLRDGDIADAQRFIDELIAEQEALS